MKTKRFLCVFLAILLVFDPAFMFATNHGHGGGRSFGVRTPSAHYPVSRTSCYSMSRRSYSTPHTSSYYRQGSVSHHGTYQGRQSFRGSCSNVSGYRSSGWNRPSCSSNGFSRTTSHNYSGSYQRHHYEPCQRPQRQWQQPCRQPRQYYYPSYNSGYSGYAGGYSGGFQMPYVQPPIVQYVPQNEPVTYEVIHKEQPTVVVVQQPVCQEQPTCCDCYKCKCSCHRR